MGMGARKAESWDVARDPAPPETTAATDWEDGEAQPSARGGARAAALAIGLAALAWIGVLVWGSATRNGIALGLAQDFAIACVPLALLAALLILLRGASPLRFGGNAAAMREEVAALDRALGRATAALGESRAAMAAHRAEIAAGGEDTAARLAEVGAALRGDADLLTHRSRALEYAAAAARADLAVLLEGMPRLEAEARAMSAALTIGGKEAETRVQSLGLALATLAQRGREVDESAGGAATRLSDELRRLEGRAARTRDEIDAATARMGEAVDGALIQAAEALERSRGGIDAQGRAVQALVEQARAAFDKASQAGEAGARAELVRLVGEIDRVGERLDAHGETARNLIGGLNAGLRAIEGRFADLGETSATEGARLAETVRAIAGYAEQVREGLVVGGDAADALIARAGALGERLEGPAKALHETLPEALARLDQQARRSLAALGEAAPQVARLDEAAATAAGRLEGVAAALAAQAEASGTAAADIDRRLAAAREAATALEQAIGHAGDGARRLADGSAAALVEAMVRVRETAQQAAERAREAISAVIPESAAALAEAGETALSAGVTRAVEGQVARLGQLSGEAAGTAQRAADRLAGQMLELSRTAAAVEDRMSAAREEAETAERESFPRRAAHLIDALNSTAIDVAKILSTDVTDSQWAAYLRGDRGIFTRRAVRLLDAGEAREIARAYGDDPEFRDQVNRYIHDFEALIRPIVAGRDGAPLAVTLVGSDMGKLYVALAQAISRLRG